MLYYQFRNYDEFKEIFAVEKRNNGAKVRKNKILLSHLKNADLLRYCRKRNDFTLLTLRIWPNFSRWPLMQYAVLANRMIRFPTEWN